jgi:hypothetical protein
MQGKRVSPAAFVTVIRVCVVSLTLLLSSLSLSQLVVKLTYYRKLVYNSRSFTSFADHLYFTPLFSFLH